MNHFKENVSYLRRNSLVHFIIILDKSSVVLYVICKISKVKKSEYTEKILFVDVMFVYFQVFIYVFIYSLVFLILYKKCIML